MNSLWLNYPQGVAGNFEHASKFHWGKKNTPNLGKYFTSKLDQVTITSLLVVGICGIDSYNWSPWITRSVHFKMILTDIGHHFDRHRHQIWFVLWRWYQTLSAILVPGLWIQAPHFPYSTPLGLSSSESSSCHIFTLLPSQLPLPQRFTFNTIQKP